MTKIRVIKKAISIHECEECNGNATTGCQKYESMPFYECPDNGTPNMR